MYTVKFILPLLLALTALSVFVAPLAERFVAGWFRHDVELRSELIFQSVGDTLAESIGDGARAGNLKKLFNRIARDERVLAAGLCASDGRLISQSTAWPTSVSCPAINPNKPHLSVLESEKNAVLISAFPISPDDPQSVRFVVLHDLTFSAQRTQIMKLYLIAFLIGLSIIAAGVTIITARLTLRTFLDRLRLTLSDPSVRLANQRLPREFLPVVREVRHMLRELRPSTYHLENIKVGWTPQTLRSLLEKELPGAEMIAVSNREPYIHNFVDEQIVLQRPASGVVTALEPVIRACKGTWIAHGSGSADKETVDERDCIAVPPEHPEYALRRIWLSQEEEDGYYYGFANEGLWPLCHISFVRPNFRESDWETYKAVNRKFADAVVAQAKTKNPVVLIQDYHFAMLPGYIREKLPDATILAFWHIPWPNPEVFSICPWREEILKGMLGSSVIGFHTQFHCQNFMDSVDRFMESHINRDQSIVTADGHATLVRPYPISIAWPPQGLAGVPDAAQCRADVCAHFNLPPNSFIGVGVERFDYTKGIIDRFQAIRLFLRSYPEWQGRFTFIQAAAPTRSRLHAYQAIHQETVDLAREINEEFGKGSYQPILLQIQHHEPGEVFRLFRAADFCIVSSLHDGMNLVAKEFVAAREDEKGVLILSTFAGASKELMESLLVNPYDAKGMSEAMHRALVMSEAEQKERMHLMREMVRDNNVFFWAARILFDAALLRKRAHIVELISHEDPHKESNARVVHLASGKRRPVS
jgi:trehalose 6-phosphate synthase